MIKEGMEKEKKTQLDMMHYLVVITTAFAPFKKKKSKY